MKQQRRLGRYEITEKIGSGGMGEVYLAWDPKINRKVAIKKILVMKSDTDTRDDRLKRFYREAELTGKLLHPNIVTVFDFQDEEGEPFIVMEYIEGRTLRSIINDRKSRCSVNPMQIGEQACEGLRYAHSHKVIHRDIKPENLLMRPDGKIKITDFSLARILGPRISEVSHQGQIMGTFQYMSPEHFDEEGPEERSDLFSLGIILYELIMGFCPFSTGDIPLTIKKILYEEPLPMKRALPMLPQPIEDAVFKALEKNIDQRYQSAEEFKSVLSDLIPLWDPQALNAYDSRDAPGKGKSLHHMVIREGTQLYDRHTYEDGTPLDDRQDFSSLQQTAERLEEEQIESDVSSDLGILTEWQEPPEEEKENSEMIRNPAEEHTDERRSAEKQEDSGSRTAVSNKVDSEERRELRRLRAPEDSVRPASVTVSKGRLEKRTSSNVFDIIKTAYFRNVIILLTAIVAVLWVSSGIYSNKKLIREQMDQLFLLEMSNRPEPALKLIRELEKLGYHNDYLKFRSAALLYRMHEYEDSLRALEAMSGKRVPMKATIIRALIAHKKNEREKAFKELTSILNERPRDEAAHLFWAFFQMKSHKWMEALEHLDYLESFSHDHLKEEFSSSFELEAQCYYGLNWREEAEEKYRQAIRYRPFDVEPYLGLAELLIDQMRYEDSLETLSEVLKWEFSNAAPYILSALAYLESGRYEKGGDMIRKGAILVPNDPDLLTLRAYGKLLEKDYSSVRNLMRREEAEMAEIIEKDYILGKLHETEKDYKGAVGRYSGLTERNPGKARYWYALAGAAEKSGDYSRAFNALTKASELSVPETKLKKLKSRISNRL